MRCRAEAHAEAAGRRNRFLMTVGAVIAGLAGVGSLGVLTLSSHGATRPTASTRETAATTVTESTKSHTVAFAPQPTAASSSRGEEPSVSHTEPASAVVVQQGNATAAASHAIIAQGRTELHDGIYVVRTGDSIVVRFDTPMTRTRRRDKFEQVVRTTLPSLYGAAGDSLLAHVPDGQLLPDADLLVEMPFRGVPLPPREGLSLTLWPETRPGQDGPLVVAYRVTTRAH
jgi:hypothetical protein